MKKNLERDTTLFAVRFGGQGVFVGGSTQKTVKDAVYKHLHGIKAVTREAAQWCDEHGVKPEMYVLAMIPAGDSVLQNKVAHVRWLLAQGQTVLVSDTVMTMAMELDIDIDLAYQKIKNRTLDEVFAPGKNLIRHRRTAAERRRTADDGAKKYAMSVEVTAVMRKKIEEEAANRGISMMEYVRGCIASDGGATVDMAPLIDLADRMAACSSAVSALHGTIASTGIVDPTVISDLHDVREQFADCCADVQHELHKLCIVIDSRK